MPGIVGLITTRSSDWACAEVDRMLSTMRHEPFYEAGVWMNETLGAYVGWTCQEGAFAARMPLRNERETRVLVFSGEEYPEPGSIALLRRRGHNIDSEGAEYLVHASEEDPSFPAGLNGRFHGLLADLEKGTVLLFNDRYGMHRLYFHEAADGFYFAAEAKAILAARPELRCIDPQSLGEFLSCRSVLEHRTLFDKIQLLPPASAWTVRAGSVNEKSAYFVPSEWEDQPRLTPDSYYENLRDTFAQRLPRYFQTQQPIAMSLTGGLDTRMIMAWQKGLPGALPCYTFGGMFRECHDVRVAREVASSCHQPFHILLADAQAVSRFPSYARRAVYLTDGTVDVSLGLDLHLYAEARSIAPIRMTGNYGGEVLRRVRAFKPERSYPGLFDTHLEDRINAARTTYADISATHPLSFAVFRQAPWHHHGSLALEETQLVSRTPYLDNELVRTAFRAPETEASSAHACLRLIEDGSSVLRQLPTDRGLGGPSGRLASLGRRALLEFSFKAEYGYDYGMPQWVATTDAVLSRLRLERLFLGRHKFYHFRTWYRRALAEYVRDMLLTPTALSRPYLNRAVAVAVVEGHLSGRYNYTTQIHQLLTLELLHQLFVDCPGGLPQ